MRDYARTSKSHRVRAASVAGSVAICVAGCLVISAGPACTSNCASYTVSIFLVDEVTGDRVCNAQVSFASGPSDAGGGQDSSIAPSSPLSDAEVPVTSDVCQWDIVVGGGTYQVDVSASGFMPARATLELSSDQCGSGIVPTTIELVPG